MTDEQLVLQVITKLGYMDWVSFFTEAYIYIEEPRTRGFIIQDVEDSCDTLIFPPAVVFYARRRYLDNLELMNRA